MSTVIVLNVHGISVIQRFLRTLGRLNLADNANYRQITKMGLSVDGRYIIDSDDEVNYYSEFE